MSKKSEKKDNKETEDRIAFVIAPIGDTESPERKRSDQIFKHIIEPIVSDLNYKVMRADKISKPGMINTQVIEHIINDQLVIADLTGSNPNVFYELALRHALQKPVIQMIAKNEKIPFDISTTRTIKFDFKDLDSVADAKKELEQQIKAVEKDPSLVDSPIAANLNLQLLKQSKNPETKAIVELKAGQLELTSIVKEIYELILKSETRGRHTLGEYFNPRPITDFIKRTNPEQVLMSDEYLVELKNITESLKKLKDRDEEPSEVV